MAITLPTRKAGSPSRRRGVKKVTSEDVQRQATATDRGTRNVPGAFGQAEAQALDVAGQAITSTGQQISDRMAAAQAKIQKRKDGLATIEAEDEYKRMSTENFNQLDDTQNFADDKTKGVHREFLTESRSKIFEEARAKGMSEQGLADLNEKLEISEGDFRAQAGVRGVTLQKQKVNSLVDTTILSFSQDPVKDHGSTAVAMENFQRDFMSRYGEMLNPEEEAEGIQRGFKAITISGIDNAIDSGDFNAAELMMEASGTEQMIGTKELDRREKRIAKARKANAPIVVNRNSRLFDPNTKKILIDAEAEKTPEEIGDEKLRQASFILGIPVSKMSPEQRAVIAGGSPLVNITNQGPSILQEKYGPVFAKKLGEIDNAASVARGVKVEVARTIIALDSGKFETGFAANVRQAVGRTAVFFNVDLGDKFLGLDLGDPTTADIIDAASKRIATTMAEDLGRITNLSLTFLADSVPGLVRTVQGNKILAKTIDRVADRKIEVASIAFKIAKDHENDPLGARIALSDAIARLDADDPIISDELKQLILNASSKAPNKLTLKPGKLAKSLNDRQMEHLRGQTPADLEKTLEAAKAKGRRDVELAIEEILQSRKESEETPETDDELKDFPNG